MTGQERESQLSAMFDGELPREECELLARRLSRDEDMRRSYAHYALIGSVIRNEPMASQAFAAKVHGALRGTGAAASLAAGRDAERATDTLAAGATAAAGAVPAVRRWAYPLGAVGLAASVAIVALLSLDPAALQGTGAEQAAGVTTAQSGSPSASGTQGPSDVAIVEEVVTRAAPTALVAEVIIPSQPASLEPESYVTPPIDGGAERRLAPAVQLANFVVAHGTVSVPMMRHSALSAFITDSGVEAVASQPANGAAIQ
jgi:negative regulator of sigma E activity